MTAVGAWDNSDSVRLGGAGVMASGRSLDVECRDRRVVFVGKLSLDVNSVGFRTTRVVPLKFGMALTQIVGP